jgi:hypothetical protein
MEGVRRRRKGGRCVKREKRLGSSRANEQAEDHTSSSYNKKPTKPEKQVLDPRQPKKRKKEEIK